MKIIDSHFHWYPTQYFEMLAGRAKGPRAERDGDAYRYWFNGDKTQSRFGRVWTDLDYQLEQLQLLGHDMSVVNTLGIMAADVLGLPATQSAEICQLVNEQMAEAQRKHRGRFYGTAIVPLHEPEIALQLLDDAVNRLGLCGLNLPTMLDDRHIDDPSMEPIYARASELGIPLFLHAADTMFGPILSPDHHNALQLGMGRIFELSVAALRLIVSGTMERYPDLKIVLFHAGGVLPTLSGRLDKNSHVPGLPLPPSHYARRLYTDTVAPHAHSVRLAREFFEDGHVFYGSDYPCWSSAAALKVVDELDLSDAERQRIFTGNILDLLCRTEELVAA